MDRPIGVQFKPLPRVGWLVTRITFLAPARDLVVNAAKMHLVEIWGVPGCCGCFVLSTGIKLREISKDSCMFEEITPREAYHGSILAHLGGGGSFLGRNS